MYFYFFKNMSEMLCIKLQSTIYLNVFYHKKHHYKVRINKNNHFY